jgi:hypothetical protein
MPPLAWTAAVAATVALLALAFGACEVPFAKSDEDRVRELVLTTMTENDPEQCTAAMTQRFVDQSFDGTGEEALARCREVNTDEIESFAEEVELTELVVADDRARATVDIVKGPLDGSVVTFVLVRDAGSWRFDALSNMDLDRAAYDSEVRTAFVAEGWSAHEADCVVNRGRRFVKTTAIERAAIAGDDSTSGFTPFTVSCMSDGHLAQWLEAGVRRRFSAAPAAVSDCALVQVRRSVTPDQLRALVASGVTEALRLVMLRACITCSRAHAAGQLDQSAPA